LRRATAVLRLLFVDATTSTMRRGRCQPTRGVLWPCMVARCVLAVTRRLPGVPGGRIEGQREGPGSSTGGACPGPGGEARLVVHDDCDRDVAARTLEVRIADVARPRFDDLAAWVRTLLSSCVMHAGTRVVLVVAGLAASTLACTGEGGSGLCSGHSTPPPGPYDLVVQLAESATVPCNGVADANAADAEPDAGPVCYASCPTTQCPPPSVYLTYLVGCTMTISDAGPDVAAAVCHYQADPVDDACQ
jgi:hypothetical protein